MKKRDSVGLIGYGRFGRLTVSNMKDDFDVFVSSRSIAPGSSLDGALAVGFEQAASKDVVILCVPISTMKQVLNRLKGHLGPNTLVVDVCSVKKQPLEWMMEILPDHVQVLGTHPMFGPDSAANSLVGHKIVLCPGRMDEENLDCVRTYCKSKGLVVIETSADEHDKQIAVSLALTHFIGRSLSKFGASELIIDTEGYQRLLHILGVIEHDTWQLFLDMHHFNPYARKNREAFMAAMNRVNTQIMAAEKEKNPPCSGDLRPPSSHQDE